MICSDCNSIFPKSPLGDPKALRYIKIHTCIYLKLNYVDMTLMSIVYLFGIHKYVLEPLYIPSKTFFDNFPTFITYSFIMSILFQRFIFLNWNIGYRCRWSKTTICTFYIHTSSHLFQKTDRAFFDTIYGFQSFLL